MKKVYLFLIAALIGIEIALGAFVAPVVFFPQNFIGEGVLTHFQSGVLMTQIFLKYNYVLLAVSVFAFIFDSFGLKGEECVHVRISAFALSFINLVLALAFVFYFTSYILHAQGLGEAATATDEFRSVHKTSEYVMKIMMLAQLFLFFFKFIGRSPKERGLKEA